MKANRQPVESNPNPFRIPVILVVQNIGFPEDPRVSPFARTLFEAGYEVHVIAPATRVQQEHDDDDDIRVHRFPPPPEGPGLLGYAREIGVSLWRIVRVGGALSRKLGPFILHLCNPPDVLWLPFITRLRNAVVIYDQHDLVPELYIAKGGRVDSIPYRMLLRMERLAFRNADLVLATNESYARIAISRGKKRPDRVRVVRNAASPIRWFPVKSREELRKGADIVLCYVGSIAQQDGIEDLVRVISWLKTHDPVLRYRCLVAGSGEAKGRAERLAEELGVQAELDFLGWVSDPDLLREVVATADIALEPCPANPFNQQSTMVKLLDYLAMGKLIIAYDLAEHRVTVGDAGVLVPPLSGPSGLGAAVLELSRDPLRRQELSTAASDRLQVAGLTFEASQRALLQAYDHAREIGRSKGFAW